MISFRTSHLASCSVSYGERGPKKASSSILAENPDSRRNGKNPERSQRSPVSWSRFVGIENSGHVLNEFPMQIDWVTWSVFGIGLVMLGYWCVHTVREFKELFKSRSKRRNND